ncbi:MAG TPA: cytochrome P450 [Acidimicrobiales bacterium]|nr:cytochrome P450 [Acidimicrobiales bacterium]
MAVLMEPPPEARGTDDRETAVGYGVRDLYSQVGDRFETFEALRQQGPVIVEAGGLMTTTREAAEAVFRHPDVFSSKFPPIGRAWRPLIPIQNDPPEHKLYRRLFDPLFSPRAVNPLVPSIERLVNDHVDRFESRGECVLDQELGVPLPTQVFLTLMGLPLSDTELLHELKDGVLRPGYRDGIEPTDTESLARLGDETARRIYEYFQAFVDERRAAPPRDDVMGRVLGAEVDGHRLTDEEVLDACFLLLIAGLDTVTNSLSLFYNQLARRPDLRGQLAGNPDLIPGAVEELLRWETPTPAVFRVAAADAELCGVPVHPGDMVTIDLGAADTDPGFQPDAGEIRFDRAPNPHYAFSGGIHRCSGSHLARQELRITLQVWHRRIPDYWIKPGTEPIWPPGLRSVENLVLQWRP